MGTLAVITEDKHISLLRDALQQITDHPETWDQGAFATCRTAFCLYGHILHLAGYEVRSDSQVRHHTGALVGDVVVVTEQLIGMDAESLSRPQRLLLESIEEDFDNEPLWAGDHSLSILWEYASALTNGAIRVPDGIANFTHPVYTKIHRT